MNNFSLSQIKVVDGYPEMELFNLDSNEGVIKHFITRLYRDLPQDDWGHAHKMIEEMSLRAQMMERIQPGGNWTINFGGDTVRAPECLVDERKGGPLDRREDDK